MGVLVASSRPGTPFTTQRLEHEPPSRVEWTVENAGDGLTRVRLVHGNLDQSPLTWENVKDGWVWILDSMKTLLETGHPLPRVRDDESAHRAVTVLGGVSLVSAPSVTAQPTGVVSWRHLFCGDVASNLTDVSLSRPRLQHLGIRSRLSGGRSRCGS